MKYRPAQIYIDLDGVLVDFNQGLQDYLKNSVLEDEFRLKDTLKKVSKVSELKEIMGKQWYKMTASLPMEFWSQLPWMKDGRELFDTLREFKPIILSTPANSQQSRQGKLQWIEENLGSVPSIIQPHKEKYIKNHFHLKESLQRQPRFVKILIDDQKRVVDRWIENGGLGILHSSANDSLSRIFRILRTEGEPPGYSS